MGQLRRLGNLRRGAASPWDSRDGLSSPWGSFAVGPFAVGLLRRGAFRRGAASPWVAVGQLRRGADHSTVD